MANSSQNQQNSGSKTTTKRNCLFSVVVILVVVFILLQLEAPIGFQLQDPKSLLSSFTFPSKFFQSDANTTTKISVDCDNKIANLTSRLRLTTQFLPLVDNRYNDERIHSTWFMSSLNSTHDDDITEYLHFPSESTQGRVLCLAGNSTTAGSRNAYALAWPDSLPENATLLPGLTFVSSTQYRVNNLWHGHCSLLPFVGWYKFRGCGVPDRWLLYHWGMLWSSRMSRWVKGLAEAVFRNEVNLESLDGSGRATCFEEAVVFKRDESSVARERWRELYDIMRCRAREFCNATIDFDAKRIGLTLLLRPSGGSRSFKNESGVISIFRRECEKLEGCRFQVGWPHNMTFCEQVRVMSTTDVLASPHGAQMTNLIFMDRNSSIMEFFPKGWKEVGGSIKHAFRWLAGRSGMRHVGSWWDTESGIVNCTRPFTQKHCKHAYYQSARVGHNEAFFSNWTSQVLHQIRDYKLSLLSNMTEAHRIQHVVNDCSCG